jgi:hypothetical protein
MLKHEYTFYLPQYVADNHGYPTAVQDIEAIFVFLDHLMHVASGYNVLTNDSVGAWDDGKDLIVREAMTIVNSTMDSMVFEQLVVPHLRDFKKRMNQVTVYVTATPVEVCYV